MAYTICISDQSFEAYTNAGLEAQDMEIAVNKAMEQAV